jgi:PhzF family phenazine biosynthesis protein
MYQIDAFTSELFRGNPAAVCPLEAWLPDALMQSIAAENNLAETAFLVPRGPDWELRWFTPTLEVPLCGHATVAAAFTLFFELQKATGDSITFHSPHSGTLPVRRQGDVLVLDFPGFASTPCAADDAAARALLGDAAARATLGDALGEAPREVRLSESDRYLAVFEHASEVQALAPDMGSLTRLGKPVIATAPGAGGVDFVSRFFAPTLGVPEDPVTGSAHCVLIPFWGERLGKTEMRAQQLSPRGGELMCKLRGKRVDIGGRAVRYLRGTISIP